MPLVAAALTAAIALGSFRPFTDAVTLPRQSLRLASQEAQTLTRVVAGRVVDAATGEALRGVEVRAGSLAPVVTDADGRFRVENAPSGDVTLNVSTVGYALARRTLAE